MMSRRLFLQRLCAGALASCPLPAALAQAPGRRPAPLRITGLRVTPIALPDPPLLAASGCHGPYFLRNIIELETDAKVIGLGETYGGQAVTAALERARAVVVGRDAFAYRAFARELSALSPACYAGIELACLDACGRAVGRRLCELLGGPVRRGSAATARCGSTRTADGGPRRRCGSAWPCAACRWNTTRTQCRARRRWPRSAGRPACG